MSGLGVAIQAGGAGRRLAVLTGGLPKALAPFAGATLLDHVLERTAPLGPERTVVLGCQGADLLRPRLPPGVELLVEAEPLGTAGGLVLLPRRPGTWLVINVDHVSDVDLALLAGRRSAPCTAVVATARVPVDEGVAEIDGGRLVGWRERPVLELPVTTGLYVFERSALARHLDGAPTGMPELVRRMIPEGVRVHRHGGTWIDAGTPERLARAEAWWLRHASARASPARGGQGAGGRG